MNENVPYNCNKGYYKMQIAVTKPSWCLVSDLYKKDLEWNISLLESRY